MFRVKTMPLNEWAQLQHRFTEVFTNVFVGDKKTALFIEAGGFGDESSLLIPDYKSNIVEALSPGGWEHCGDVAERRWTLLVGNASAIEDFGLRGARD